MACLRYCVELSRRRRKKRESDGQDEAETKVDAPYAFGDLLTVGGQDDQRHDTGDDEAEIDGEVGGDGDQQPTPASNILGLVRRLGAASTAGRVLA